VTTAPGAYITFLQPIAHIGRKLFSFDPTLSDGLRRGAPLWSFYLNLAKRKHPGFSMKEKQGFFCCDYENATDFICFNTGKEAWRSFCMGMNIVDPYIVGVIPLI
jgi:hypothetical protein